MRDDAGHRSAKTSLTAALDGIDEGALSLPAFATLAAYPVLDVAIELIREDAGIIAVYLLVSVALLGGPPADD